MFLAGLCHNAYDNASMELSDTFEIFKGPNLLNLIYLEKIPFLMCIETYILINRLRHFKLKKTPRRRENFDIFPATNNDKSPLLVTLKWFGILHQIFATDCRGGQYRLD